MKVNDPRSFAVIGAAMEVHREPGCGFLESVYHEAMKMEMTERGIPFQSEPKSEIYFKGKNTGKYFVPDFICYNALVIELKAEKKLIERDEAQIINALKATKLRVGLLINFGEMSLKYKRYVN